MKRVVFFSGGVGSWAAAKRVAESHGTENLTLLFTDTLIEDEDCYRFLGEAAANVGGTLVKIADGRTPWEVFRDERFMGNTRIDPCSRILKRELAARWVKDNCEVDATTLYIGIDWTEKHRLAAVVNNWHPWKVEAPMCEPPLISRMQVLGQLAAAGINPPRLYSLGFPHNNCGGFCIKAGHAHFALLHRTMPERYAEHEAQEEAFREFIGQDVSILRDRRGGQTKPLTLKEFRERRCSGDMFEWGGCGCFV